MDRHWHAALDCAVAHLFHEAYLTTFHPHNLVPAKALRAPHGSVGHSRFFPLLKIEYQVSSLYIPGHSAALPPCLNFTCTNVDRKTTQSDLEWLTRDWSLGLGGARRPKNADYMSETSTPFTKSFGQLSTQNFETCSPTNTIVNGLYMRLTRTSIRSTRTMPRIKMIPSVQRRTSRSRKTNRKPRD